MISIVHLFVFIAVAVVVLVIPGPSVLFVIGRALAHGRKTALASMAGNELGELVSAMAVAFGVGAIVQRSAVVFTVMKLMGAAYLIYLGAQAWRGRRSLAILDKGGKAPASGRAARDGFIVGVSNPKTAIFFTAILPQFVDKASGHVTLQLALLGVIFVLMAFVTDSIWVLAASRVRAWIGGSPRRLAAVGGTGGLTMIGLGLTLAVTGRRN